MSDLNLSIRNIRNISQCDIELPLEKGLYALVGENGCGKSTLMLAMSLLVKQSSRKSFLPYDLKDTSSIDFTVDEIADHWHMVDGEITTASKKGGACLPNNRYHGFYEGSIFYGSRFYDYNLVEEFLKNPKYGYPFCSAERERTIDRDRRSTKAPPKPRRLKRKEYSSK